NGYEAAVRRAEERVLVDRVMWLAGASGSTEGRALAAMKLSKLAARPRGPAPPEKGARAAARARLARDIQPFPERPPRPPPPHPRGRGARGRGRASGTPPGSPQPGVTRGRRSTGTSGRERRRCNCTRQQGRKAGSLPALPSCLPAFGLEFLPSRRSAFPPCSFLSS